MKVLVVIILQIIWDNYDFIFIYIKNNWNSFIKYPWTNNVIYDNGFVCSSEIQDKSFL